MMITEQLGQKTNGGGAKRVRALLGTAMSVGLGFGALTLAAQPAHAFLFDWGRPPAASRPLVVAPTNPVTTTETRRVHKSIRKDTARTKAMDEAARKQQAELREKAKHGPLQIIVSLKKQELVLYANGEPIVTSRVSSGKPGHSTPTGVFAIFEKDRWHRSNLYENAPMYFMQRITWGGVALHEGIVPNYPASHGCIRLPGTFARTLWGLTERGVRVIVTREPAAPIAIAHQRLADLSPQPALISSVPAFNPAFTPLGDVTTSELKSDRIVTDAMQRIQVATSQPAGMVVDGDMFKFPAGTFVKPAPAAEPAVEPISILISRKDGKIFVRKNFKGLFEAPVTIANADQPLGTHVLTALTGEKNAPLKWTAVSMPSSSKQSIDGLTATAALDRITIPAETLARIAKLMAPGSSFVITDRGLDADTRDGAEFTVITR